MEIYNKQSLSDSFKVYFDLFISLSFTISYIMLCLYWFINKMTTVKSKNKSQKLPYKLASYLFIAVTIFTAFSSYSNSWIWIILN